MLFAKRLEYGPGTCVEQTKKLHKKKKKNALARTWKPAMRNAAAAVDVQGSEGY